MPNTTLPLNQLNNNDFQYVAAWISNNILDEDAYIQSQNTYTGSIGSNPADVQDANMPNPLVISEHSVTLQTQADVEDLGLDEDYFAEEPDTDQEPNPEELQASLSILEALKHALTFKISLLSEFPEDEIIISPNRFVALKSELDWGETCTYKAKVFTHCHSFACKASVMLYASLQLPITNLTKGEETFTSDIAATEWFLKHKNDEGLCSSYVLYPYNCADCGTLTSGKIREFTYNKLKINCIVCYLSSFKTCYYCNNVGSSINGSIVTNYVDGDVISVCSYCLSSLNECIKCGKLFKTKPLFNGYCIKCSPSVIMDYSYKPDPVFFDSPSDFAEPHLGIELEVEMKEGIVQYSNIIANRFLNAIDNEFIYLKKDSSISNGGFEIVSHPATLSFWHKNSNFWESIKKLTRTCESWSVDNCGMHVHISRSAFLNVDHIARFILFINTNRLLSAFVAERYNAKQAPFLDIDLEEAKKIVNNYYKIDRHSATNIQTNIPTVEVRIFKGNLKRQRIMKNLEFVHSLFRFTEKSLSCSVPEYLDFVAGNKQTYPNLHTYISKYKRKL